MQVEVKTQAHVTSRGEPEVVMRVNLLPRGSGNRNKARAIARAFRQHEVMKPWIKRVVVGTSTVVVHMRAGMGLLAAIDECTEQLKARQDVPGQGWLFATG